MAIEISRSWDMDDRASECLEDLRVAVLRLDHGQDDCDRNEILDKLESLKILLSRGSSKHLRQSDEYFDSPLQVPSYKTSTPEHESSHNQRRFPRSLATRSSDLQDGQFNDFLDLDDTLESDDSFLRLSTMLERSISQGQEALSSPRPATPRMDARKQMLRSPMSINMSPSNHFPMGEVSTAEDLDEEPPLASGLDRARSPLSVFDDSDEEDLSSHPPEYMPIDSNISKSQSANSVIDDGLTALNGLIDQLTNSAAQRTESGLTSSKALFLCSIVVLLVSFLVASHKGELGINCHCICPTMTTT